MDSWTHAFAKPGVLSFSLAMGEQRSQGQDYLIRNGETGWLADGSSGRALGGLHGGEHSKRGNNACLASVRP
jgi:hypothetical protein